MYRWIACTHATLKQVRYLNNSIRTDEFAAVLRRNFDKTQNGLFASLQRMSSGLKVLSAKDDASGVVLSSKIKLDINGINVANRNIQDGACMFNVAEGALLNAERILTRLRGLSLQCLNSTCDDAQKSALQNEADELAAELERIQLNTKYKDISLFNNPRKPNTSLNNNKEEENQQGQETPQQNPITPQSLSANPLMSSSPLSMGIKGLKIDNTANTNPDVLSGNNEPAVTGSGIKLMGAGLRGAEDTGRIAENESNDGVYITGAFDFAKNEEYKVNIDGITYTIKNRNATNAAISYSKEISTGIVTFTGNTFTVTCDKESNHSIVVNGKNNWIYGGDLVNEFHPFSDTSTGNRFYGGAGDDTFNITGYNNGYYGQGGNDTFNINPEANTHNSLYGGDGNDTFINTKNGHQYYYGDAGDDTFISTNNSGTFNGGVGNDTFNITGNNVTINANDGNDIITVAGNNGTIYGNDGDDSITVSGSGHFVDGGTGVNAFVNNAANVTSANVPGANSYTIDFGKKETKDVVIETSRGNFKYTITNRDNSVKQMTIKVEEDGLIDFKKGTGYTIEGEKNVSHYIKLTQSSNWFYGGDIGDTVTSASSSNRIYTGKGKDNVTVTGTSNIVETGDGDDTLTVTSYDESIFSGNGNDTINYSGYMSYIEAGAGDDKIIVKSNPTSSHIDLGSGNDVIRGENANGTVNNNRTISYSLYTGDENDSIQLAGKNVDNSVLYFLDGFGSEAEFSSFRLGATETKDLVIHTNNGDITYNVYNRVAHEKTLKYKYDEVEDKVIFMGHDFTIKGQTDVQHKVEIYGSWTYFYGGDLDDELTYTTGGGGQLHGGGGNDTLSNTTTNAYSTALYGDDGEDTIYVNNSGSVYGGKGNDTIHINVTGINTCDGGEGDDSYYINKTAQSIDNYGNNVYYIGTDGITLSAGAGNDTFYITGSNNNIAGGGGDDYFIVSGTGNNLDGGTGDNYIVDNTGGNATPNLESDPNAGELKFSYAGQEHTFEIENKIYTVKNCTETADDIATNSASYTYNANTGEIIFTGSNLTISASGSVGHNIRLHGDNNTVSGSSKSDTIIVGSGTNNIIKGNAGDDIITLSTENNAVEGGLGNDTIHLNATTTKMVDSGDGNDILFVNSSNNTNIQTGSGNDTVRSISKTSGNTINLSSGNNDLLLNGDKNIITSANGSNRISVVGTQNNVSSGSGKNTIGANGNGNILAANGNSTFNIQGNQNNLTLSGNNNTVNSKGTKNSIDSIGNNTLKMTGAQSSINSIGNSKITINGDNSDITSIGRATINVSGADSNINSIGNSTINQTGNSATIEADAGDITVSGDNATLSAKGAGLNIYGNGNTIENISEDNAKIAINIQGDENNVKTVNTQDNLKLKGNNNTLSLNNLDDRVEITGNNNTIDATAGTNVFRVRGDENNLIGGSDLDSFRINSGSNNKVDGGEEINKNTLIDYAEDTVAQNCIDVTPMPLDIDIQVGPDIDEHITTTIKFGLGDFYIDFSDNETTKESMQRIDNLLDEINAQRAKIGATLNRFESLLQLNATRKINLENAKSIITDCDIAKESYNHTMQNIKQNILSSLFGQTYNLKRDSIMQLLYGIK